LRVCLPVETPVAGMLYIASCRMVVHRQSNWMAVAGGVAAAMQDACSGFPQACYIAAAYRVAAAVL
jgi:hypothetical protein